MRDLLDFLPHVLPHAMACPDPVAVKYLREAAQEFCARTRIWRETDEFPTLPDEEEVLCVPPYAALHEIDEAWFDTGRLEPKRFDEVFGRDEGDGQPRYITQAGPDRVKIVPHAVGTMRVSMFLKPAEGADVVPDMLFDHHARTIGWGALREVLMLPNQPFSDPQKALMFGARFDQAVNRHFAANLTGQHRARGHARGRYF